MIITPEGKPVVVDFGLARCVGGESRITRSGDVLGTPSYMPPEQVEGSSDVGPTADVYAQGAMLYDCLTGRPPFVKATALGLLVAILLLFPSVHS